MFSTGRFAGAQSEIKIHQLNEIFSVDLWMVFNLNYFQRTDLERHKQGQCVVQRLTLQVNHRRMAF